MTTQPRAKDRFWLKRAMQSERCRVRNSGSILRIGSLCLWNMKHHLKEDSKTTRFLFYFSCIYKMLEEYASSDWSNRAKHALYVIRVHCLSYNARCLRHTRTLLSYNIRPAYVTRVHCRQKLVREQIKQ